MVAAWRRRRRLVCMHARMQAKLGGIGYHTGPTASRGGKGLRNLAESGATAPSPRCPGPSLGSWHLLFGFRGCGCGEESGVVESRNGIAVSCAVSPVISVPRSNSSFKRLSSCTIPPALAPAAVLAVSTPVRLYLVPRTGGSGSGSRGRTPAYCIARGLAVFF